MAINELIAKAYPRTQIHYVPCYEPYMTYIESGKKTVEGRVGTPFYTKIHSGDILCLHNRTKEIWCEVVHTHLYPSFRAMLEAEGLKKMLPQAQSLEEGEKIYRGFPTFAEKEPKFGAYAIQVHLIDIEKLKRTAQATFTSSNFERIAKTPEAPLPQSTPFVRSFRDHAPIERPHHHHSSSVKEHHAKALSKESPPSSAVLRPGSDDIERHQRDSKRRKFDSSKEIIKKPVESHPPFEGNSAPLLPETPSQEKRPSKKEIPHSSSEDIGSRLPESKRRKFDSSEEIVKKPFESHPPLEGSSAPLQSETPPKQTVAQDKAPPNKVF